MKKLKSILLILAVCLFLSSCAELDNMKNCHALDMGDGTLKLNNQLYKLLDIDYDGSINVDFGRQIYVTDPDVPVLLSQTGFFKHLPIINKDDTIISSYYYDYYSNEKDTYYIREDKYDYFVNTIKNGIDYTKFFCGPVGYNYHYPLYYFSDSQNKMFLSFINSVTPVKETGNIYTDNYVYFGCKSSDGIFQKEMAYQLINLDDGYCVLKYTNKGYYYAYNSTPEYDGLFADIFESVKKGE